MEDKVDQKISVFSQEDVPVSMGLVIDTSSSVTRQFPFEQKAAVAFLQKSLTDKKDQAFVVGFSSDVLLVQDLTSDETKISEGIQQLAPSGGTALWDAVKFASDKLGARREDRPPQPPPAHRHLRSARRRCRRARLDRAAVPDLSDSGRQCLQRAPGRGRSRQPNRPDGRGRVLPDAHRGAPEAPLRLRQDAATPVASFPPPSRRGCRIRIRAARA